MPLLSYEAFPTLFDDIIAEADFATELALRLCCKSLRDAVDRKQVRHLVLTPSGKDGTAVRGPVHRVAALRRLSPKSVSRLSGPMRELLKHVRVLDVRGFFPATCNLTHYKKTFPALSIVRLCTRKGGYTPYVPVGARTLVVFTSPHGSDCNPKANTGGAGSMDALMDTFSAMFGDGPAPGPVVPRGIDPSGLPKTVRRIVVNMNGEDYAVAEMHHFVLDPPEQVEEIVILLPRVKDEGGRLAGQVVSQEKFAIKIIAMDLAELMVSVPGLRWTLVGLEHAHRIPDAFRALLRKQFEGYQFGEGLCLLGNGNTTEFAECVAHKNGNTSDAPANTIECKGYDERVSELQRDVPNRPFPIYTVNGMGSSAPINEDNRVAYSSIQEDSMLIDECCEMAANTSFWWRRADTADPSNGRACIFHKDEAEQKNIYEIFWRPCIENGGGYPIRLNNVTGTGAGHATRASVGVVLAAAALAMLE